MTRSLRSAAASTPMASASSSFGLSDNWLTARCLGDNFGQYKNGSIGNAGVQQRHPGSQKSRARWCVGIADLQLVLQMFGPCL